MLVALLEVDVEPRFRVLVVHIALDVDVDAAEGIDELRERLEVEHDILMDRDAEQLVDLTDHQRRATLGVDRADAHEVRIARRVDPGIARDRDAAQLAAAVLHAQDEYRVRLRALGVRRVGAIVESEYEHVRVAVEARVDCALPRRAALRVASIHRLVFLHEILRTAHERIDAARR